MAPYSPPTGGREGKLRLDFNENTVGCSPRVIEALKQYLTADHLPIYPEYAGALADLAEFFQVTRTSSRSLTAPMRRFSFSSIRMWTIEARS